MNCKYCRKEHDCTDCEHVNRSICVNCILSPELNPEENRYQQVLGEIKQITGLSKDPDELLKQLTILNHFRLGLEPYEKGKTDYSHIRINAEYHASAIISLSDISQVNVQFNALLAMVKFYHEFINSDTNKKELKAKLQKQYEESIKEAKHQRETPATRPGRKSFSVFQKIVMGFLKMPSMTIDNAIKQVTSMGIPNPYRTQTDLDKAMREVQEHLEKVGKVR